MAEGPNELLDKGTAAFRAGKHELAETLLQQVVARQPGASVAHTLLSFIARKRGDLPAAERLARQAVEAGPMEPGAHDALIAAQIVTQEVDALLDTCRRAAADQPDDFGAIYRLGTLLFKTERVEESVEWLRRALELAPETVHIEFKFSRALYVAGKYGEVLSVIREMRRRGVDTAAVHELAGKVMSRLKQPEDAVIAYRRALERNPDEHSYHAGLSAALFQAKRLEEAQEVTKNFLRRVHGFTLAAKRPKARVLVVSSIGVDNCYKRVLPDRKNMFVTGNSLTQVRGDRNTYHFTCIEHPDLSAAAKALGPINVIYNNLAGAESSIKSGKGLMLREFADRLGLPVVNAPEAIERTTRANNARIITENTDIIYPKTILYLLRAEGTDRVRERILEAVRFPMLIRRTYTNKDTDVAFAADEAALTGALDYYHGKNVEEVYAIEFVTEEFRPGIYRKIRCAIIDHVVYPVRVDFSTHWNVRRQPEDSALSKANQDLMDNEHAFLADSVAYLGAKNMARLETLGRLHDLDFLGVDFNIIGDGEMVVFEANPAMNCIEDRQVAEFPYFADYWERVLIAFEDMIVKKAGKR